MQDDYTISPALLGRDLGTQGLKIILRDADLFQVGEELKRSDVISKVNAEWERKDGKSTQGKKVASAFKKIVRDGLFFTPISDDTHGIYEFIGGTVPASDDEPEEDVEEVATGLACQYLGEAIGEGDYAVYAWYLPQYARNNGETWPIKIGKTASSIEGRIRQQATVLPEQPVICFQAWFPKQSDADWWEGTLHRAFSSRQVIDSPGTEWFRTTPNEIEQRFDLSAKAMAEPTAEVDP